MNISKYILEDAVFQEQPPVLVDIGASGGEPQMWKELASHSIYLGFDADTRATEFTDSVGGGFRRKIVFNRAVVADGKGTAEIHLTSSPYCSSVLRPASGALEPYAFKHLFKVESTVEVPAITLHEAISTVGLKHIDFLKIDTQGTDLRIFKSLPEAFGQRVLAVEMEPGFISVYDGEDKAWHVLSHMEDRGFWLAQLDVRNTTRADATWFNEQNFLMKRYPHAFLGQSAGWCNMLYLSEPRQQWSYREWLLSILFAAKFGKTGAALCLCDRALGSGVGGRVPQLRQALWRQVRLQGYLHAAPRLPRALLGELKRWILQRTANRR